MVTLKVLVKKFDKLVEKHEQEQIDFLKTHLQPLVIKECMDKQLYFRTGNGCWYCFNQKDGTVGNFSKPLENRLNYLLSNYPLNNIGSLLDDWGKPNV